MLGDIMEAHVEQKMLTRPEHLISPSVFAKVRDVFRFCWCLLFSQFCLSVRTFDF